MIHKEYLKLKTSIPQIYHELLPRKNITAVIDRASLDEAVCFIAPYGCGKTLAVVSWLKERGRNATWVTLDAADDSDTAFFATLSAAVMRLAGWQGIADDILSDPKYIEGPLDFLWDTIETAEKSGCDKILVLDSLFFIRTPSLLRSIKELISALLGRWRIIITSRADLPPVFNDLILKRRICLITLKELCFSTEETAEFFNLNGCPASRQDIMWIHGETEGWPVSLNVILTISRGGPVEYGEAAREYVTGFFETEIWSELDDSIKDFLLKTSILDTLSPSNCNAVTGIGSTTPILRRLFVNGLFISRLNESKYRYQNVFRAFLRYKFRVSGLCEKELYKKTAWWMFERMEYEQAFPYFFKAGDMYGLSRVFRVINSAEMGLERYLELTSCVTSLNAEDLRGYPLIVAKMALIHYALGNIAEMQRLYDIYLEWIEPGELELSPEEYAECVWEAGWLSYINPTEPILGNKHEEWFNYAEYDPSLQTLHHSRAAIYRFPSILRGVRDYCPVLDILEDYVQQNKNTGYGSVRDEVSQWRLEMIRAEYAYELEDFAKAEQLIKNILIKVEDKQFTDLYFVCIALLVKIVKAVHSPKEIGALMSRLETTILKNGQTFLLPQFHAFKLRNRLAEGIPGQTEAFEKENKTYAEKPYFYLLYRHMTLVRALLSTGDYNEAVMILGNMERLCHQYNRILDLIEVNILKAVADFRLGNEDGACLHLMEALDEARKYGFIRIFSDDAKDLWPILELVSDNMRDDYIKSIIISCKKTLTRAGIRIPRKNHSQFGLTKTELKILKTLGSEMSYKEIALDNDIKISTVKSHIRSIYSKLDVSNKTSAVIAAKSRGIID